MEGGELAAEGMDTLTELGDELTLGDIDGRRREKERGWGGDGAAGLPTRVGERPGAFPRAGRGCWGGRRGGWSLAPAPGACGRERGALSRAGCGARSAGSARLAAATRVSPAGGALLSGSRGADTRRELP